MKILQLAPYFMPYVGGQERFVYFLSRELVRKGHQVTLFTSNYPKAAKRETVEGIEVVRYPILGRPFRNPLAMHMVFSLAKAKEYDLIYTHNEHSFPANLAALAKLVYRKPLVISSHGELVFDSAFADLFRKAYWFSLGRSTLLAADKITVATPSERERLRNLLGISLDRINLMPVGVDLAHWDRLKDLDVRDFVDKHQLDGKKVVLTATQMIKRKGIQYLIEAMAEISGQVPNAVCLIAGKGEDIKLFVELSRKLGLEKVVKFIGVLDDEGLAKAYKAADVFVLPSLGEGQPTCIMEAWAFSNPVVATQITGVVDYYNEAAVLVRPRDPVALGGEIVKLLQDEAYTRQLGQAGRELVESKFTWQAISDTTIEIFKAVVENTAGMRS